MPDPNDIHFYQTIDIPGIGECRGDWDHRQTVDAYLGHVDVKGKTVLDVGPANGFFSFEMEKRGATVTALDLGEVGHWDAVPNAESSWTPESLRQQLRSGVKKVENAFWLAHGALKSKVKFVYGSVYDAPAKVAEKSDVALMSNVLQHLRDPFLAIQRVAETVRQTIIITESLWHNDENFLNSPDMRLLPCLEMAGYTHSWWLVSPRLVTEIIKLLGFADVKCTFHDEQFNGDAPDPNPRLVRHYTITGTRPGPGIRFIEGWHDRESDGREAWRWSRSSHATMVVKAGAGRSTQGNLTLKIGTLTPAHITISVDGESLTEFDCSWPPLTKQFEGVFGHEGDHRLEILSNVPPMQPSEQDTRKLGFAVFYASI